MRGNGKEGPASQCTDIDELTGLKIYPGFHPEGAGDADQREQDHEQARDADENPHDIFQAKANPWSWSGAHNIVTPFLPFGLAGAEMDQQHDECGQSEKWDEDQPLRPGDFLLILQESGPKIQQDHPQTVQCVEINNEYHQDLEINRHIDAVDRICQV